mmetsp:Transcript_24275/g.74837  ORF Transcript_24275/g.74837 Transcript_24275/m.74837 type:complete len:211 (-) Transcript_24275:215-847(-)
MTRRARPRDRKCRRNGPATPLSAAIGQTKMETTWCATMSSRSPPPDLRKTVDAPRPRPRAGVDAPGRKSLPARAARRRPDLEPREVPDEEPDGDGGEVRRRLLREPAGKKRRRRGRVERDRARHRRRQRLVRAVAARQIPEDEVVRRDGAHDDGVVDVDDFERQDVQITRLVFHGIADEDPREEEEALAEAERQHDPPKIVPRIQGIDHC